MTTSKREYTQSMNVTGKAKELATQLKQRFGQPEQYIASAVFEWLSEQPDEIALPIIHALPQAYRPDFARLVLERMAAADTAPKLKHTGKAAKPKRRAGKPVPAEVAEAARRTRKIEFEDEDESDNTSGS